MDNMKRNGPAMWGACALVLIFTLAAGDALAASFSRRAGRAEAEAGKHEVPLTIETFAHTLALDGQAGAVLSFELPEAVHKGLFLNTFADLCVFDAQGTPVPFQLRSPEGTSARLEVTKDVPHFLWQPEKTGKSAPGSADIEISASGAIVRIRGQESDPPEPGPVSYLLDLEAFLDASSAPVSPKGEAFSAQNMRERVLRVHLGGDEPFMASVSVKTSADLSAWTDVGRPRILIRTRQGEVTLERDSLDLLPPVERYLLLQFADSNVPIVSFSGKAVFDKTTHVLKESIATGTLSGDKRTVSYEMPGRFPLTAIGFDLPQPDMMAVRLMGADDPLRPFTQYASGFIYRLEKDGAAITGEPFAVRVSRHYWNLAAVGDIPFASVPGLRAYWQPRELLFLARGTGPWTLAYGRTRAVEASSMPLLAQGDVQPAREIAAFSSGGTPSAAPPSSSAEGNREWLLWAVLVLAAAFLSGMAVWLARSMKKQGPPS